MIDVLVERSYDTPVTPSEVFDLDSTTTGCFERYRLNWQQSFFGTDGRRLICHFQAPDAESVRQALRQSGAVIERVWTGTVHPGTHNGAANVIVTRQFEAPVAIVDVQAREDAHGWCLQAHNVNFVGSYFSRDNRRMLCLYMAPDAEAVRKAQRQAGMPVQSVWPMRHYRPDNLPG